MFFFPPEISLMINLRYTKETASFESNSLKETIYKNVNWKVVKKVLVLDFSILYDIKLSFYTALSCTQFYKKAS